MAAELLTDPPQALPSVDVFSLGVTLWECATLREPPRSGDEWRALREHAVWPCRGNLSSESHDLLCKMVAKDGAARCARPSFAQPPPTRAPNRVIG